MTHVTEFGLIRHGQTAWNAEKRIQGQTDTDLSATGIMQADAWGASLAQHGWTRILCSDLKRSMDTAAIINNHLGALPISTDPRLREQDWGNWVGRTVRQLRADERGEVERQEAAGWHFTPTGGESRLALLQRTMDALRDCAARHPDERILVVTHLGCIKAIAAFLAKSQTGQAESPEQPQLPGKYGLHRIRCTEGRFSIIELNGAL